MDITKLVGNYLLKGTNQDEENSKYEGSMNLSLRSDGRINAVWRINPDQMQYGVGQWVMDQLVIDFNYVGVDDIVFRGVVSYKTQPSGVLEGTWTEEAGDDRFLGKETAVKIKTEELN